MPVPPEYSRATDHFYAYLLDVRDIAGLGSTHQAWTMTQAVLQTFRRRLTLQDAIRFAGILPVGLRALFVADWDPDEPQRPFAERITMTSEVRSLRAEHNFSPDTAISDVASAVRRHVDETKLERLLAGFPAGATDFWRPE
jgi:uncharacterized protein (DUF2267 family)